MTRTVMETLIEYSQSPNLTHQKVFAFSSVGRQTGPWAEPTFNPILRKSWYRRSLCSLCPSIVNSWACMPLVLSKRKKWEAPLHVLFSWKWVQWSTSVHAYLYMKKREYVLLNIVLTANKLCMSPVHYLIITDYTIFLTFTLISIKRAKR